jgi:hypothetical protein
MDQKQPNTGNPDQYPARDTVEDLDRGTTDDRRPAATPRDRQERGNAGPKDQPGFGQGA